MSLSFGSLSFDLKKEEYNPLICCQSDPTGLPRKNVYDLLLPHRQGVRSIPSHRTAKIVL